MVKKKKAKKKASLARRRAAKKSGKGAWPSRSTPSVTILLPKEKKEGTSGTGPRLSGDDYEA